eukprot:1130119-Pleurochrysis_carterae.AAC.2
MSIAWMLADAAAPRALQNDCLCGGRLNRSVCLLQPAHPYGRRVHHDFKAYHLGQEVLLQPLDAREAVTLQYAQVQADLQSQSEPARHQISEAEAPAATPAAAPPWRPLLLPPLRCWPLRLLMPATPPLRLRGGRSCALRRREMLARQETAGVVRPMDTSPAAGSPDVRSTSAAAATSPLRSAESRVRFQGQPVKQAYRPYPTPLLSEMFDDSALAASQSPTQAREAPGSAPRR